MSNKAKIWLYKEGNECNAITGGWTQGGHVPAYLAFCGSKEQEYLHITSIQGYRSRTAFVANNMIDMSYFNKVYINFNVSSSDVLSSNDQNEIWIVGSNIKTSTSDNISGNISSTNPTNTVYFTAENESVFTSPDNTPCYVYIEGCIDHTNYFDVHDVYVESKSNVINIVNNEDDIITFNLNNINNMIEFTQVDILVDNEIVQSYKDNLNDSISYNFSNNKFFTIQATYTQGDDIVEIAELEIGFRYENGIDENTLLYLRGDTYTDLSPYNNIITNSNTTIVDGSYKFVTGSNQYMYITDNDSRFAFGSNDFTIEFNITFDSFFSNLGIFTPMGDTAWINKTGAWHLIANNDKTIAFDYYSNTSTVVKLSSKELVVGESYHFALSVKNSKAYMFIDGILFGTKDITVPLIGQSKILIGKHDGINYICHNGTMSNIRISNVAKYIENFELPTQPYTSVNITDIKFDNNNISCQVYKGSDNESISKVDVLLNGDVINSLTENYDIINQTINEEEYVYGNNEIEVRAYYYDDYYVSKKYNYYKDIPLDTFEPLPNLLISSDLYTIKNRISEINAANKIINSNLKKILETKGLECGETPRLSKMVEMVKQLGNNNSAEVTDYINKITALQLEATTNRSNLATVLQDEGVDVTEEDDMASLISKVDEEFDKQVLPAVCTNGITLPLYSYTFDITHNGNTPTDYEIGYTFFNGYVSIGYSWATPNNTYGLTHLTFISKDKDGNIIHTSETFDDNIGFPSYYENIKVVCGGKLFARVDTFSEYIYMELKNIVLYCNNIDF